MSFHSYADDFQLHLSFNPNSSSAMGNLLACVDEVKSWMAANFLSVNKLKTEVFIFGPPAMSDTAGINLGMLSPCRKHQVKKMAVIYDSALKFNSQINDIVKASFIQLRMFAKIKPLLAHIDLEKIIHVFIFSRLDYSNSLCYGTQTKLLDKLQMVQNVAARPLTGTRKYDHIFPALRSLHWLPVPYIINFKILIFVFKSLHGTDPPYIMDLIHIHESKRSLQSNVQNLLHVPQSTLKSRSDYTFAVAAPRLWNSLTENLRQSSLLNELKKHLKTFLLH